VEPHHVNKSKELEDNSPTKEYTDLRILMSPLLFMPDGEIRRVRVSKGTGEIGKGLFSRILKQQLGGNKQRRC
jgi:hypothetical protein